ncbi:MULTISPECIES: ATP-binding protein [Neptunomonas]|uniref:ATP-binding protein n=1 Tax=Neptunomonas TaxID=75687 RepID=UPI0023F68687|nr:MULTISPECIES: ATP-binding protein [Neptunomonas]MDN2659313.1 ATP-binding protein [Neptunomonas sp. CHC150]MDO6468459.1 ATP-binding protein [Neptunomonas phycophila]
MKPRFLQRLIKSPLTLTSRILIALAAGVILAQTISAVVWYTQWRADSELRVREVSQHMAFRVASTVQFFTSLPTSYRHVVLNQLRDMGGTRFFVTLNREYIHIKDLPDSPLKTVVVNEFQQALKKQLGIDPDTVHIKFSRPADLHVLNNETLLDDLPARWADLSLLVRPSGSPILVMQLPISDKEWLYLATVMPDAQFLDAASPLSTERLMSLVISLMVILLLGVWIVRVLLRPLRQLVRALESFGKGEQKHLPERGSQEVITAAKAFNAMQGRIQRYLDDREKLFASISHDLKTPITRLRLRAEMLEDDKQREAMARDLEDLDIMVKGALQSVKDTDIHENRVEVDLWRMMLYMADGADIAGKKIELSGQQRQPYLGKPLALKRCIGNLLDNALYYGKEAYVTVTDSDVALIISIRDQGPGIPDSQLVRVFQPYTRLTTDHSNHPGMGLGLSISRNIARAHGGEVSLRNHPQGGLVVTVTLPRG